MNKKKFYLSWENIDWQIVHQNVYYTQIRIFKAKLSGEIRQMYWLQKHLINRLDAKLLAVQQLSMSLNSSIADNLSNQQKLTLAKSLKINGKAPNLRKNSKSKDHDFKLQTYAMHILKNTAKQILAKFALEPEWEAVFEPNTYGFRPARQPHDAIQAVFWSLRYTQQKWIYHQKILECFSEIDHRKLIQKINTFPVLEKQIDSWLQTGILECYNYQEQDVVWYSKKMFQNSPICPLILNIALHGLETHLNKFVLDLTPQKKIYSNQASVMVIHYAYDFIVIHENKKLLKLCIMEMGKWFENMGLKPNSPRSRTINGAMGFYFLGFQIIQISNNNRYNVKITPSKQSQQFLLLKIRQVLQKNKSISTYGLICKLRPLILHWGSYFRFCECQATFKKLSHRIFLKLRAWVFRRDPRSGRNKIKQKYFPNNRTWFFNGQKYESNWVLYGKTKNSNGQFQEIFLPQLFWVKNEKYIKIKGNRSPYDGDRFYWIIQKNSRHLFSTKIHQLMKKQNGECSVCGKLFNNQDLRNSNYRISKQQLSHKKCPIKKEK